MSNGIKTPGPDESEQIKTGPSWVIEFGIRFSASVTPLIVALGTVNIVSTTDCRDRSSPWSIWSNHVYLEDHKVYIQRNFVLYKIIKLGTG